jgi:PAS domain S-box-containing protein
MKTSFENCRDFDPAVHQRDLFLAWEEFVQTGQINRSIIPPYIAESWERSKLKNVDPFNISSSAYLDEKEYKQLKIDYDYLINISKPFMETIYQSLEQSHYLVVLYNPGGYHLLAVGQRAEFELRERSAIREGLCFEEDAVGTCGFSLAKSLRKPIQIAGCEHYCTLFHYVVGSYAPIQDPIRGDLMGVIGITTGWRALPNPHTLGIAIAASTAIENHIKLDNARKTLSVYAKALQTTMNSLDDGIILVNNRSRIYETNDSARQIFSLKESELKGVDLSEIAALTELKTRVQDAFEHQQTYQDLELRVGDQMYLTTIQRAFDENGKIQGVIVQLKNFKTLSKIVHNLTGDQAKFTFKRMIGTSSKIKEVKKMAKLAARSDTNVIIEGESGTGKEVLAQAIHNASERANEPFVVVNCSAIPYELMESTLFGHEKGSFTGAIRMHIGKFEIADHGTVFLDEISEMPTNMQAKLLRVLEESKIERIGGQRLIDLNIRVIAATNRNLIKEINEGRFREDLFYRLNVFWLKLPPLRERKKDIYELVPFFLKHFASLFDRSMPEIAADYYDVLMNYDWPGNIRELKNAVQHSIVAHDGTILRAKHLFGFFSQATGIAATKVDILPGEEQSFKLSELEEKNIRRALQATKGNKTKAAKKLGIGRTTLHRKLKKETQP